MKIQKWDKVTFGVVIILVIFTFLIWNQENRHQLVWAMGALILFVIALLNHLSEIMPLFPSLLKKSKILQSNLGIGSITISLVFSNIWFSHKPFIVNVDGKEVARSTYGKSIEILIAPGLREILITQEKIQSTSICVDVCDNITLYVSTEKNKIILVDSIHEFNKSIEIAGKLHRSLFIRIMILMTILDILLSSLALICLLAGGFF